MAWQLFLGTVMIGLTVAIHVSGITVLIVQLGRIVPKIRERERIGTGIIIGFMNITVIGVILLHTMEIWLWAALYMILGEFQSIERALYFSAVTFTALGYGDIVLSPDYQLLSGLHSANGVILIGVSTAFIFGALTEIFRLAGKGN